MTCYVQLSGHMGQVWGQRSRSRVESTEQSEKYGKVLHCDISICPGLDCFSFLYFVGSEI